MERIASVDLIIAALPLPTVVVDMEERIAALNPFAETLFGSALLGRHFITALRHPDLVEAVEDTLRDRMARKAQYLTTTDGHDVSYQVDLAPLGQAFVILSFQDKTQLERADQMRRDFVANVSHELRTPLTALMGFIETLRGPAKEDAVARLRFLDIMGEEAERMNRLVGDLLSLSRVEADERVRPTQQIDLQDILRTTLRNLSPLAVDNDVALVPDIEDNAMMMLGDRDQLIQVLTNLIENAIKYASEGKRVEITAQTSLRDPALRGPAVRILVRDFGSGIEARHIARLTERFYRADSHRSRALGGTGLGLAIVKHILNRHRGRLKVSSVVGEGACFTVILPLDAVAD